MATATAQPEASGCKARTHAPNIYRRRRPERTLAYQVVQGWLATWLAQQEEAEPNSVAGYVERELRGYLECGILAHGFARARCPDCAADFLIAFSCKGRGVCPSCTTKRMAATAAHLVEAVIPRVPMRQWVLALPKRLRPALRADPVLATQVLRAFIDAIGRALLKSCAAPTGSLDAALRQLGRLTASLLPLAPRRNPGAAATTHPLRSPVHRGSRRRG